LSWGERVSDGMIRQRAASVSPSPRFAESAEQNGERAGVRCFDFILAFSPHDAFATFGVKNHVKQRPRAAALVWHWMLDVGCSMLDVSPQ